MYDIDEPSDSATDNCRAVKRFIDATGTSSLSPEYREEGGR